MNIELSYDGKTGILKVIGTLSFTSLKDFEQQLANLDFTGLTTVILDLQDLEHTDSSGVSGIIHLHKILSALDIALQVGKISRRVDRLFEQMRLFEIIPKAEA
jgi:anti-anti-sigma factor